MHILKLVLINVLQEMHKLNFICALTNPTSPVLYFGKMENVFSKTCRFVFRYLGLYSTSLRDAEFSISSLWHFSKHRLGVSTFVESRVPCHTALGSA